MINISQHPSPPLPQNSFLFLAVQLNTEEDGGKKFVCVCVGGGGEEIDNKLD